ncbi:P-loop NTPase fold protein [Streptomyces europaeiscabiei]|uniref:P-loop NTPase fold protein n=1 Tax=Streptomyces europaeiscabiei TaxID=146819 RepID=UPI0029BDF18F|nr:P-loop NTPase fold protein [Streptomyces europaeiscabiei]MDX3697906.1 P-loop NTPase fold protein [Streptomyces europaeiscabiei]
MLWSLLNKPWLRPVVQVVQLFAVPNRDEVYERCVNAALDDPPRARKLGKRPGTSRHDVFREMHNPVYRTAAYTQASGAERAAYDKALVDLERARARQQAAADEAEWNWKIVCALLPAVSLIVLITSGFLALLIALLGAALLTFLLFWSGTAVWFNLRYCLLAAALGITCAAARVELGYRAVAWGVTLHDDGIVPVMDGMIRHLMGEDPDSVFVPQGTSKGLRAPRAPGFAVPTEALERLQRKLSHLDEGTIAVCGPRGVGKSTLLENAAEQADFGFVIQAPATYAPHDFLVSLSVRLCQEFMQHEDYPAPEFARLSHFHRMLESARRRIRALGRWSSFALPAAALLVLGVSSAARSLYAQYSASAADTAHTVAHAVQDWLREVWNGHAVVTSVIVIVLGIAWWLSRHDPWIPRTLGRVWSRFGAKLGFFLAIASLASVFFDPQLRQLAPHVRFSTFFVAALLAAGWSYSVGGSQSRRLRLAHLDIGRWRVYASDVCRLLAACLGTYLLYFLIRTPSTYALLADPQNPLRLAGLVTGTLLARAAGWRPRPAKPHLITRCENHLYRLQTIQTTTNTLSNGTAQIMTLGGSHATSISTLPPNFPALVEEFRDLLTDIAEVLASRKQRVLIAIDEVDRLGSDTQALAFLAEIKAILGVRHVYYLISVAEDVGAAFVRRGLPHRDVTDSSLDDIIHMEACTLKEARTILDKRSEDHTPHTALLAHSLSGGLLRDLLRYGLQIEEIQAKTLTHELAHLARELILEELSETLAGFRTLLSKQQWTQNTSGILSDFRTLCGHLKASRCGCFDGPLLYTLEHFAHQPPGAQPSHSDITDNARQLIDEAAAYSYFSLTLLEIFTAPGLDRRSENALVQGSYGAYERLAEARLELGISPYSARTLITHIRKAWSLNDSPNIHIRGAAQRQWLCPLHGSQSDAFGRRRTREDRVPRSGRPPSTD